MSDDIRTGRKARKILTIMAAVLAVAMMLATPLIVAVDSDAAEIGNDEAGFRIVATDPTDEDLAAFDPYLHSKVIEAKYDCNIFTQIFDLGFNNPTFSSQGYEVSYASGAEINSKSYTAYYCEEFSATGVEMVYTFNTPGELIESFIADSNYQPAAEAIKEYFGNEVGIGDTLKITGTVKTKSAEQTAGDFAAVDDNHSVTKNGSQQFYIVNDIDVTIEFIKNGSSVGKIYYRADDKYLVERNITYDYGSVDYKDITDATPLTVKFGLASFSFENGSARYTVDGTEYKIGHSMVTPDEIVTTADVRANSDWNANDIREQCREFTNTADGKATIDKTFDAVKTAYGNIVTDVVGDDLLKLVLIIVGVVIGIIVLLIVLIIVVVVLLKKKKQQ